MPVNRVVAFLTPAFTALAAIGSGLIARHLGITFSPDELLAIEVTAATAAGGAALKFLHGHQKVEARLHEIEHDILTGYIKVAQFDPQLVIRLRNEADTLLKDAEARIAHLVESNATAVAAKEAELNTLKSEKAAAERDAAAAVNSTTVAKTELARVKDRLATIQRALGAESGIEEQDQVLPNAPSVTPAADIQPPVEPAIAESAPLAETQPVVQTSVASSQPATQTA